jgi:hypothetical protein
MEITGLTQFEKDVIILEPEDVMKKHKVEKQYVYDRRYTVKKRIKAAGIEPDAAAELPTIKESVLFSGTRAVKKAATKKAATKKAAAKNAAEPASDVDIMFTIDRTPPPLPMTADEEKNAAIAKIKRLAEECPVDAAIIIPAKYKSAAMKMLNAELQTAKWKAFEIHDNPNAVRIYKKNP